MGNAAYEARRAAEEAEAKRDLALAKAGEAAADMLLDFFSGKAHLQVTPPAPNAFGPGLHWTIRMRRDPV